MIRPMRGQVVIKELPPTASAALWTPTPSARQTTTHTGRVLALGPPARTAGGVEVPYGFAVGDLVQFHYEFLEKMARNMWEGEEAVWVPQSDCDGVWVEPCERCSGLGVIFELDEETNQEWEDHCPECIGTGEQTVQP